MLVLLHVSLSSHLYFCCVSSQFHTLLFFLLLTSALSTRQFKGTTKTLYKGEMESIEVKKTVEKSLVDEEYVLLFILSFSCAECH